MNATELLAMYDRVADAPDAVGKLRKFVLDLAVRGKLVSNDFGEVQSPDGSRTGTKERELEFGLPASWKWHTLGEVAAYGSPEKVSSNSDVDANVWVLDLEDIEKSTGRLLNRVSSADRPFRSTKSCFLAGDVLFGKLRPYLCKVLVASEPGVCTTEIVVIRPKHFLAADFLKLVLRSPLTMDRVNRLMYGMKMPRLGTADARSLSIPLAPLAEQHRIVAKVDELMALCDQLEAARVDREAARDRLAAASLARLTAPDPSTFQSDARFAINVLPALSARADQVKLLRQTILNLAVRGKLVPQDARDEPAALALSRLSAAKQHAQSLGRSLARSALETSTLKNVGYELPTAWAQTTFDDVFLIVSGVTKGQTISSEAAVEVPYLRVANVQRGHLDLSIVKMIEVRRAELHRYLLQNGDVLMTEGGDWDKLGRAAIWRGEIKTCIHQNHVFRVRPATEDVLSEWVALYVNSPQGRAFFENASKQTTNLASINMTQLRGCSLPLPPIEEQHRIVARVDELMTVCDQLEAAIVLCDSNRTRLFDALLREALEPLEPAAA